MSDNKIITPQVIAHTAKLARLKLTPEEELLYAAQLEPVMEHINHLNRVDTSQINPSFQIIPTTNRFHEDEIKPSLTQSEAVSSAPKNSQGYIVGPRSIDK